MTNIEVLKRCPVVRELNDDELKKLADIGTAKVLEAGDSLSKQGRTQEDLYVIEDGLVGIYLDLGPVTRRQLQAASNFEVVGWSSLMPPYRARTTVIAIETTKAVAFNGKELAEICEANPHIGLKVYKGLASVIASRLGVAYTQLMGVGHQD